MTVCPSVSIAYHVPSIRRCLGFLFPLHAQGTVAASIHNICRAVSMGIPFACCNLQHPPHLPHPPPVCLGRTGGNAFKEVSLGYLFLETSGAADLPDPHSFGSFPPSSLQAQPSPQHPHQRLVCRCPLGTYLFLCFEADGSWPWLRFSFST